ncbi:DUF1615 family protein [Dokdonella sp.]|uniref:DUF1615 domain-containing protein n=1 Tax=Dokdonella sp. TaxID=2291710 RepID=UPI0026393227|nr:DUF1615 family protein [Dokdonella sp.]
MNPRFPRLRPAATTVAILALLAGCATQPPSAPMRRPADTRADIVRRLPDGVKDREGWATDITAAFSALGIEPTTQNLCASLAVIGQESTFVVDPTVPGLGRIARAEIDRRAADHHIPQLLVRGALAVTSSDGRSYADRIATARTERELSLAYEDLIDRIPLGQRLFAGSNPIRTAGPMQVSVDFAERHAREHGYPYATKESVRHELFTRRGGVYFGIAHLLGYPANYDRMVYRFADFNAGFYASRNAAFQNAVSLASGIPLALDGDLVAYGSGKPGATELATRTLSKRIGMGDGQIRRALDLGESPEFERSTLYERVFALAEQVERKPLPRATMPRIALDSPKITRKLTTEWFANRVDQRYRACLAKAPAIERPS